MHMTKMNRPYISMLFHALHKVTAMYYLLEKKLMYPTYAKLHLSVIFVCGGNYMLVCLIFHLHEATYLCYFMPYLK